MDSENIPQALCNKRKCRPTKRKFRGNRFTGSLKQLETNIICDISHTNDVTVYSEWGSGLQSTSHTDNSEVASPNTSSSFRKLHQTTSTVGNSISPDTIEGYRIICIENISQFIQQFPCPKCLSAPLSDTDLSYSVKETRHGLSSTFHFTCKTCYESFQLSLSAENINLRFQMSMFSIGINRVKSKRFLTNMNMPSPVAPSTHSQLKRKIVHATKICAEESMKSAAAELKSDLQTNEVTVSCDGTWQRRGFSSKNGIATVLSVNPVGAVKVIDVEILSNHCDACSKARMKYKTDEEFLAWKISHKSCQKNHDGVAGQMEPNGMIRIFRRSEDKHGLKYVMYLGDGDSKSFKSVADAEPTMYPGIQIEKLECCGHVQKRMGRRLLDKIVECKGKQYEEDGKKYKGIGNVGRLTKNAIMRIQGHYGAAIRENIGSISNMRKSIMAILKHRSRNHEDCGEWCPKDVNKANKNSLPQFVVREIKPIFDELSSDSLLSKCLHGETQNSNESFHNLFWNRCPKAAFLGRDRLEISVYDAVIVFNDGELGRRGIFDNLGLVFGKYCVAGFSDFDSARVASSLRSYNVRKITENRCRKTPQQHKIDKIINRDHGYIPGGF